jgi:acetyl-CoA acyltransferase
MREPVIVDAIRTPFTRRGGAYSTIRPDALLGAQLQQLVARSGVPPPPASATS